MSPPRRLELLERRLLFVTGKGGVGKTSVAAALGLLAAGRGKRTLLVEIDAKGSLNDVFETGPLAFEPRQLSPQLFAMAMDTRRKRCTRSNTPNWDAFPTLWCIPRAKSRSCRPLRPGNHEYST